MKKTLTILALAACALGTGCSAKVRSVSAMHWRIPDDEATKSSVLYATYWEGSCSSGFGGFGKGCDTGDTKVLRCNVKPDNSMTCQEEADANAALAKE